MLARLRAVLGAGPLAAPSPCDVQEGAFVRECTVELRRTLRTGGSGWVWVRASPLDWASDTGVGATPEDTAAAGAANSPCSFRCSAVPWGDSPSAPDTIDHGGFFVPVVQRAAGLAPSSAAARARGLAVSSLGSPVFSSIPESSLTSASCGSAGVPVGPLFHWWTERSRADAPRVSTIVPRATCTTPSSLAAHPACPSGDSSGAGASGDSRGGRPRGVPSASVPSGVANTFSLSSAGALTSRSPPAAAGCCCAMLCTPKLLYSSSREGLIFPGSDENAAADTGF
mmetsp:Transcript_37605/g.98495  ORF Transcript_37605/g.98495 Transcript_37605/m.98495 type:complete len:284 (+) Transcript_37605:1711-2562(+)